MLSLGKRRGLAQCSTPNHAFAILALDHRQNLRNTFSPEDPGSVTYNTMVDFKRIVIETLAHHASALLLDPEYGAGTAIAEDILPGSTGLMIALETTGYGGESHARATQILADWNVDKIKRIGASAVKLLIYYHPDSRTAHQQENLIGDVAKHCQKLDIPLFLEILTYSIDPRKKSLPSTEKHDLILESTRRLSVLGIDVLKVEFPLNIAEDPDQSNWYKACRELSAASSIPWVLLSANVPFEKYIMQVKVACQAGASGVAAGRAVWKESVELKGKERTNFLKTTAVERVTRLFDVCNSLAKPWTAFYPFSEVPEFWYRNYPGLP